MLKNTKNNRFTESYREKRKFTPYKFFKVNEHWFLFKHVHTKLLLTISAVQPAIMACSPLFSVFWRKNWLYLRYHYISLCLIFSCWTIVLCLYLHWTNKAELNYIESYEAKNYVSATISLSLFKAYFKYQLTRI